MHTEAVTTLARLKKGLDFASRELRDVDHRPIAAPAMTTTLGLGGEVRVTYPARVSDAKGFDQGAATHSIE